MINIHYLRWDTKFFKFKIGQLNTKGFNAKQVNSIPMQQQIESYDLLYLISDRKRDLLVEVGAHLMDERIIYQKRIIPEVLNDSSISVYRGKVTNELLELAMLSGHQSRFFRDKILSYKYEKMYSIWIERSLKGQLADMVFIHKTDGLIDGFVTIYKKNNVGHIGLIAVATDRQGCGIGSLLLNTSNNWFAENNLSTAIVATQSSNLSACQFYERNSYQIQNTQYIYHLWAYDLPPENSTRLN